MRTTRVFSILSLTTTASRVFRSPTALASFLAQDRLGPREVLARLRQPRRVLGHAHRELEPEVEDLLGQLPHLLEHFVLAQITPLRGLHRPYPLERSDARHELRRDAHLLRRRPERLPRRVRGHAFHLVENPTGLDHRHPFF